MDNVSWTYQGYWNTVIGAHRTAASAAREFDLVSGDFRGFSEWLGEAESTAWSAGGKGAPMPEEWSGFHKRAAEELQAATAATCPHCGNHDPKLIEDNGCKRRDPRLTMLCIARVKPEDSAFDDDPGPGGVDVNGLVACGMQWEPNS
jgi:hypothetical protein